MFDDIAGAIDTRSIYGLQLSSSTTPLLGVFIPPVSSDLIKHPLAIDEYTPTFAADRSLCIPAYRALKVLLCISPRLVVKGSWL